MEEVWWVVEEYEEFEEEDHEPTFKLLESQYELSKYLYNWTHSDTVFIKLFGCDIKTRMLQWGKACALTFKKLQLTQTTVSKLKKIYESYKQKYKYCPSWQSVLKGLETLKEKISENYLPTPSNVSKLIRAKNTLTFYRRTIFGKLELFECISGVNVGRGVRQFFYIRRF